MLIMPLRLTFSLLDFFPSCHELIFYTQLARGRRPFFSGCSHPESDPENLDSTKHGKLVALLAQGHD